MTTKIAMSCSFNGSSALSFDNNRLKDLVANRNSIFHLDLSGKTMTEVLKSFESFHKKQSPKYTNSAIVSIFKRLEESIGQEIIPIDITDIFYGYLYEFLLTVPGPTGKSVKPSTIKTYFQTIQSTLSWASKHNCKISETYNCWNVENYEKTKIALTPSQIAHIYYFDLEDKLQRRKIRKLADKHNIWNLCFKLLKNVRDHFVISCQLGQRYSDSSRFDPSNFDETKTIYRCTQQKTGSKAVVNLSKFAIDKSIAFEILKKCNYKSPVFGIDINLYNKYLHLLCHAIGGEFARPVTTENKICGVVCKDEVPAWKLICSHTARRTFVTYWATNENMSTARLQKCTGHKDIRQISNYTIIKDED